jgi:signal transduction histidine kinase
LTLQLSEGEGVASVDEKLNILLVDDQPGKLLTYEAMLSGLGENLIKAHDGTEALGQLLTTDISLVLMDVSMPGMDGFETARMIHQHPRFHNIPIIFVSGLLVSDMDRLKGYEHGAVDYVPVPVSPQLLRAKVKVFTELHRKTRQLEELNARITLLQEEERRRIARELHDSIGQLLAAIKMNAFLLESEAYNISPEAAKRASENVALVDEVSKQVRTISYLLHPPLLDEVGLASALRSYVEGFARRSEINTKLEISPDPLRLPEELELSVFRLVQECLTNIHRHSRSPTARIQLLQDNGSVKVEVEDAGKGFQCDKHVALESGIGLRGLRERLRQLGGTLEIESNSQGTKVIAIAPFALPDSTAQRHGSSSLLLPVK